MKKRIIFSIFALCASLSAETNNQIDNGYGKKDVEHGKFFYDENVKKEQPEPETINIEKGDGVVQVLTEILKELKSQKEEMKKIKYTLNPNEPKMMTNSKGEPCLSNSNADCFDIPVITEGRNMPALFNFIKEPNEENAKTWLQLQAKLFNHYTQMGFALKFASLNGDENTYPVNALNIYTSPKDNITADLYLDRILEILDEKKDEIGTLLFLGKSKKIDEHWGKSSLAMTAFKKGKYFNIAVIFDTIETKNEYDEYYNNLNDKELVTIYKALPKAVSDKIFDKYNITLTPTAVAIYKTKDKEISSVIERGYITQNNLLHNYQNFLVYNKIVEPKEFHSAKIWDAHIEETK